MTDQIPAEPSATDIALVGVAGRFPGAADVAELWDGIRAGRSGITKFADAELLAAGVPRERLEDPDYVKAGAVIDGIDRFDADFFGFNPKEAQILDPQHRLFLEHCWHALEDAGCDPARFDGSVGVFGGSAISTYMLNNLGPAGIGAAVGELAVGLANDKDSLTLRVAHALGLSGPSYAVQSYCSTSLVAVCAAATSLANLECDLALAGGVAIAVPDRTGYLYQHGGISSPDGECRAFDASGQGSLIGNGVGVVALRRLEDALADGDRVYAVIRGWAVNNDAGRKVGFTAPGVKGQAAVIAEALAAAGLEPADIDYLEAHGTGTALGDAAELAALQQVFEGEHLLLGSVKTNLGHLDRAAGVTGLIKTALALHHGEIPPTLNYREPNPQLAAGSARLEVVADRRPWPRGERTRRAGVSAFGIGGTNAHVVLEEAPLLPARTAASGRRAELLVWSARTAAAVDEATQNLATHLEAADDGVLGDAAYTLQTGRRVFEHRRVLVADTAAEAAAWLREGTVLGRTDGATDRRVAFLLSGTGEQYPGMAAELHETEPVFREVLDECRAALVDALGADPLEDMLRPRARYGRGAGDASLSRLLGRAGDDEPDPGAATDRLQPALFAVEYALARLVKSWGVEPDLLVGYSLGEYVAACLSGVLSLPDALALVAYRAKLIHELPAGAMAAVPQAAANVRALIDEFGIDGLDIAAVNGPELTVVSGLPQSLDEFEQALRERAVPCRRLATTHAFHSRMMEPVRGPLTAWLSANITLRPPAVPYVSNVTGELITAERATDPGYWAEHMCGPVRFDEAMATVLAQGDHALLEIGPGQSLGAMARGHRDCPPSRWPLVVPTLPAASDPRAAGTVLAEAVGRLWLAGVPIDWAGYQSGRAVVRTGLPGYPFQRERYWIDAPAKANAAQPTPVLPTSALPLAAQPVAASESRVELLTRRWIPADESGADSGQPVPAKYVLTVDADGFAEALARRLGRDGSEVAIVQPGAAVLEAAEAIAGWGRGTRGTRIVLLTRGGHAVRDGERAEPIQAALAALPVVANQEYPNTETRGIDLDPALTPDEAAALIERELRRPAEDVLAAFRDGQRYVPDYVAVGDPDTESTDTQSTNTQASIRPGGTYLVTGGLGGVGLILAGHLARSGAARVILASRGGVPEDPEHPRARAVRQLRALGAEISTPRLDIADPDAVRALFAEHRVDGVVHAAADSTPETFQPLSEFDAATTARHFGAKVEGARVLADALADLPADRAPRWCLVFSSTSAILGGLTFGAYAAANAALTAVSGRVGNGSSDGASSSGTRWISAAWDTWPGTLDRLDGGFGAAMAAHTMTERQALDAFDRVLAQPHAAVIVAVGGLTDRLTPAGSAAPAVTGGGADGGATYPRPELPQPFVSPVTATERALAELWTEVLGVEPVGTRDNFFDLKGNSLLALQMLARVKEQLGVSVPTVALFEAPTVHGLAAHLDAQGTAKGAEQRESRLPAVPVRPSATAPVIGIGTGTDSDIDTGADLDEQFDRSIAIVGMAGRFPGAADVAQFWRNLCDGVESITFFTPEELIEAGVDPELVRKPGYVPARAVLDDITSFDAGFFGMSPRMASLTDPQQRLFLEVCWEALEHSGYANPDYRGRVGVFGGSNISTYLFGLSSQLNIGEDISPYEVIMSNDKDALTTSASYLFDLRGPSVAVQTFCSTSLVGVHLAVQSLRSGDCEMALAGGVSVSVPDKVGHLSQRGGMESHDGHVHTFDARARGTMFGDGATIVVLKRLADALRDGDTVHAVIRGSALNNDGAIKAGYTAPSVAGQARVISAAMADAGVTPDQVGYVEAHGTATELGDPIEVAALTRAFGPAVDRQSCAIGAVKTNIGHLNHAAGTAGLIKTALTVRDGAIPATLNYATPNPEIDFAGSPFYVNTRLAPWSAEDGRPRIAGLNSLGMGGTNVHVVVEQPPDRPVRGGGDADRSRRFHVLPVSARTEKAADEAVERLGDHLKQNPQTRLADAAYTLQVGRKPFEHRRATVVSALADAVAALTGADGAMPPAARIETAQGRPVALLLAGVGEQYPGLVGELYRREPVFRAALDDCLDRLDLALPGTDAADLLTGSRSGGGADLAALLGRAAGPADERAETLERTEVVQPLMFAVDYAIARTLTAWGVRPSAMLGYSLGEYVAACLSGVLSLDDALALVAHRAKLIADLPAGAMAAVPLGEQELRGRFRIEQRGLDIAAVNGAQSCVVAGPAEALDRLADDLGRAGVPTRPLRTTHAFHSRMLEPAAEQLTAWIAANVTLNAPTIPYLSNVTGEWITADQAADPAYWAAHMCRTVRFADGVARLLDDPQLALVEIGPGQSLGAMVRAAGCPPERWPLITATLPAQGDARPADEALTECLARLWLIGVELDWAAYHGRAVGALDANANADADAPGRIPLPSYSFQRQRYWIEPAPRTAVSDAPTITDVPQGVAGFEAIDRKVPRLPEEQWVYQPVWRQTAAPAAAADQPSSWVVYADGTAAEKVLAELRRAAELDNAHVFAVRPGPAFAETEEGCTVRPGCADDAQRMLRSLQERGARLERVVHLWTLDAPSDRREYLEPDAEPEVWFGLHTLVALARAAGELGLGAWALDLVTAGAHAVLGGGEVRPEAAMLLGPALVIPLEYPSVATRLLDIEPDTDPAAVLAELRRPRQDATVALRGGRRWVCGYETLPPASPDDAEAVLREGGVYLLTGGLGGIALGMAEHLAKDCRAKLVLFGRRGLPPREQWARIASGELEADEGIRSRVTRVLEIQDLGAEIEIAVGDVADPADVRHAVELARERFGALHGVLHTAGVAGTGLIQFKQPDDSELVLAPKVSGVRALHEALRLGQPDEVELDFMALFSSITSATGGGPGQVDYCAANAYLDGYAASLGTARRRVLSVDWGEWTWNAWDFGLAGYDDRLQAFFRGHRAEFGITFAEGWRSLLRALASGETRVVVSTQDLPTMVRLSTGFTVDAVTSAGGPESLGERHPRPELLTPYQEPAGPVEQRVAEVWADLLKLERVGVLDNFFELGGSSLLGIPLLVALRRAFPGAELPPHILYEAPTVAALAKVVEGSASDVPRRREAADSSGAGGASGSEAGELRRSGLKAAAARRRRP